MISVVQQLFKNIATTYLGTWVGLAITFFFTPYLISKLGKDLYGIWQLSFSILAHLRLVDMGMKQSIVRYISKFYAVEDWKQLNEVFSSAIRIYSVISLFIVVIVLFIVYGLLHNFNFPAEHFELARNTILLLGLDQAITYFFIPFTALGAFHRFDIGNYLRTIRQVIQVLIIITLLELGYSLVTMAIFVVILNLLFHIAMNGYRIHNYPKVRFSRSAITHEKTRDLFNYGIYSFGIVVAWMMIFQTDNVIIGWLISVEAVAMYSVAAMLVAQIRGSIGIIATPLVPTISHLEAGNNFEMIRTIYRKSTRYLYFFSGFITISVLYFGGPFINLWLGPDFEQSVEIIDILIVAGAFYIPQSICNSILLGISRHKIAFYILGAEALSNIILSIILVKTMGIVGVALGTAIPQLFIYIFVYPIVFHRVIQAEVRHFYLASFKSLGLSIVTITPVAFLIIRWVDPDNWGTFFLDCGVVTLAFLVLFVVIILDRDDRNKLIDKLRGFLKK